MGGVDLGLGLDETSFTHALTVSPDNGVGYTVSDCATPSNTIGIVMPFSLSLTQETAATFSPGWSTSHCACWSGGAVVRSSQVGARATWVFDSWKPSIALVSDQGPTRGTADIYVDGIKVGSIIGYSRTTVNMVVAWSRVFADGNFAHTLDVVVTQGRVDIDAFLSSSCALAECQ